nr:ribonuclease H-like domain-containing protein [Tanacetum cinerariifolium]
SLSLFSSSDHSISHPIEFAKNVFVLVGTFHFSTDYVVVDFDADPRVPLILERSFLKTGRALIDVFEGELTLRVGKEAITFNLDQTSSYSANYNDMTTNRIDVIDMACEEYSQEVLGFSDVITSGNPTPYSEPIVSTSFPTLTPFGDSDFLLEEVDGFLALEDDPTSPEVDQSYFDTKGDILLLEAFFNDDPSLPPPTQGKYLPQKMRIEQYFLTTNYSLWEVILNGDSPIPTRVIDGVVQLIAPTTTKQILARKNELKARGTLLMALPDKHQLKFNIHKDAKSLTEAIEKRFVLKKPTHKVENSNPHLEEQDRSRRLKFDDLFNTLKIYEVEVKSSSSTSPTTQNIAFVSSQNTNSTNESVSVVTSVSAASTKVPVSALPNVDTLNADDLEEMDLKWQMAMLTIRERMFLQRTGRNLGANETTSIGFDMSKVESYNCHRRGNFARECRSPKDTRNKETQRRNVSADEEPTNYALMAFTSLSSSSSDNEVAPCSKACTKDYATLQSHYDKLTNDLRKSQFDVFFYKTCLEYVEAILVVYQHNKNVFEEDIKLLKLDVMLRDNALVELRKKFEKAKQERDELKLQLENFQTSSKNLSKLLASQITNKTALGYDNQVFNSTVFDCDELISSESDVSMPTSLVHDRYKSGEGYHVVPPPYTRTSMPSKPDLVFHDAPTTHETVPYPVEHHILAATLRKDIPKSRGHKHSWNRKACFVCKSLTHLIKECDYYKKKMAQMPVRNRAMRGNPHHALKDKGVIDSGCSRHMTENISYLCDFEEINRGYVAFGINPKGSKIT